MPSYISTTNDAATADPGLPDLVQETQPLVTPVPQRTAIVDSEIENLTNLIVNISGTPWNVKYYSQVVGADDQVGAQQLNQLPVYQQYINIKELEIRVQEPLTENIDSESNNVTVEGSAMTYPNFIPNVGDAFLADIGNGRLGVFYVNDVNKLSTFNESCYKIGYTVVAYGNDTAPYVEDLEEKTVKTLVFTKELLSAGRNELLVEEDHYTREEMSVRLISMLKVYFAEFYDKQLRTIMYPDNITKIYDKFIVRFIQACIDQKYSPMVSQLELLNTGDGLHMDNIHILTVIQDMSEDLISECTQKMWKISTNVFMRIPAMHSLRFMGVSGLVYPSGYSPGIIGPSGAGNTLWSVVASDSPDYLPYEILEGISDDHNEELSVPMIHPVNKDDFYIFSEAFYTDSEGQSALEILLRRAMRNETIPHKWLMELCRASKTWRSLERVYYVPVLAVLMRGSLLRF